MYTCILIHEFPEVVETLTSYITRTPFLSLRNVFSNPVQAFREYSSDTADLVFIGGEMKGMSGFDFVEQKRAQFGKSHFWAIFILEQKIHLPKGYLDQQTELLMRPLGFEKFEQALERIREQKKVLTPEWNDLDFFFAEMEGKKIKIYFGEIDYVEAAGNYVTLITRSGRKTIYKSMHEMESILPPDYFLRFHKSFITSIRCIYAVTRSDLILTVDARPKSFPLGLTYRDSVLKKLKLE